MHTQKLSKNDIELSPLHLFMPIIQAFSEIFRPIFEQSTNFSPNPSSHGNLS